MKLQRKDNRVKAWISNDADQWKLVKDAKNVFAEELSVGLSVNNGFNAECTANFDLFHVEYH